MNKGIKEGRGGGTGAAHPEAWGGAGVGRGAAVGGGYSSIPCQMLAQCRVNKGIM